MCCGALPVTAQSTIQPRRDNLLDNDWRTVFDETNPSLRAGFEQPGFNDSAWNTVQIPHNWDDYVEVRRLKYPSLYGTASYRRTFTVAPSERGRCIFLYFEGVGSYAKVWVNGEFVGKHDGGRTTFTLDVTDAVHLDRPNLLAVQAAHPYGIQDLPWGDGLPQMSSEGSQPVGIFRPVHLITTGPVRVEPFGVHVWNDDDATESAAVVHIETDVRNYSTMAKSDIVATRVRAPQGNVVANLSSIVKISPGQTVTVHQDTPSLGNVQLWSPDAPHLYTLETTVEDGNAPTDRIETPFGIRVIKWPTKQGPFLINGKPFFINGVAEYEHLLGNSHAFSDEQIRTTVHQVEAAGFNAFRDAHQPHNLRFQTYWDRDGILWWPQFCSGIWFDTPAFQNNFKTLLREWVRERRNSPSVILWGLSNESRLPMPFARECTDIIRQMDPTSPSQRLVTTCNGGTGTDWNVPQNWSGTYGGTLANYAAELTKQRLVGEYGAWRGSEVHTEGGFIRSGTLSEDRFAALLETKVRLAESVRNNVCGHFQWLLNSHENPGRAIAGNNTTQCETPNDFNEIGPVNNKGLFTLWGEPTDAYFMYRANYAPVATDPMVAIVSHTWPDRWTTPGIKNNIIVYSNCQEVELFNDYKSDSLGRRTREGRGTHFQWDNANIQYNVLYAEGRVDGKVVATDAVVLHNLADAPHLSACYGTDTGLTAPIKGMEYLYRVNCGGPDYTDAYGSRWSADHDFKHGDRWGCVSWAAAYPSLTPRLGSSSITYDPIVGTRDQSLFQTFRFGREKLHYLFAVPNGRYTIDLYFMEPWYGRGGGDASQWRLFDAAVNGATVLRGLDIWKECGYSHALKKTVHATVTDGWLDVSFPHVASEEAVISAIAISKAHGAVSSTKPSPLPARLLPIVRPQLLGAVNHENLAPTIAVYPVRSARLGNALRDGQDVVLEQPGQSITWTVQVGLGGQHDLDVSYDNNGATPVAVEMSVLSVDTGLVSDTKQWQLAPTSAQAWETSGPAGGLTFNAGKYTVTLKVLGPSLLRVRSLSVK
jgi:hypothetical protein